MNSGRRLIAGRDYAFQATGNKSLSGRIYLWRALLLLQLGPDTLELQTDIRLSAGENEILLKMSDDLGQALTPEIIFRSAGSTLVNDIIHRLSCVGSTPGLKGDKQHQHPDTVVLTCYRKNFTTFGFNSRTDFSLRSPFRFSPLGVMWGLRVSLTKNENCHLEVLSRCTPQSRIALKCTQFTLCVAQKKD